MKIYMVAIALTFFTGCGVKIDSSTVKEMPTGYLCSFLDPNTWWTIEAERAAIFAELNKRNADCILPSGAASY